MIMKPCNKCGIFKSLASFYRNKKNKDGHVNICKDCKREIYREYQKQYNKTYCEKNLETLRTKSKEKYHNNKEKFKIISKKSYQKRKDSHLKGCKIYYIENKEKILEHNAKYRNKNRPMINAQKKEFYQNNKEKHRKWAKDYAINNKDRLDECRRIRERERRKDPFIKINKNISAQIRSALKEKKNGRHWESIVNFTLNDLINHLESQFREGMAWENYGKGGWHIDHKFPVSWWKFRTPEDEDFKRCWALKNLQPLWEKENLSKQNFYFHL